MTITSGSPGITSITLVNSENASSTQPPTKAPTTPKNADSTKVMPPTTTPMVSEPRVAYASWAKMSWPVWVVPRTKPSPGGIRPMSRTADGSPTTSGPTSPNKTIRPVSARPIASFKVIGGRTRRRRTASAGSGDAEVVITIRLNPL
jgi:hypothetical protein